jgi:hypothetical protein
MRRDHQGGILDVLRCLTENQENFTGSEPFLGALDNIFSDNHLQPEIIDLHQENYCQLVYPNLEFRAPL